MATARHPNPLKRSLAELGPDSTGDIRGRPSPRRDTNGDDAPHRRDAKHPDSSSRKHDRNDSRRSEQTSKPERSAHRSKDESARDSTRREGKQPKHDRANNREHDRDRDRDRGIRDDDPPRKRNRSRSRSRSPARNGDSRRQRHRSRSPIASRPDPRGGTSNSKPASKPAAPVAKNRNAKDPSRSRSPSPAPASAPPASSTKSKKRTKREDPDAPIPAVDPMLARFMGFDRFRSTKNTKVPGNSKNWAIGKEKRTEYRQYMNRQGGFNRPLSPPPATS